MAARRSLAEAARQLSGSTTSSHVPARLARAASFHTPRSHRQYSSTSLVMGPEVESVLSSTATPPVITSTLDRRRAVRTKLAHIEATRGGVVSPFLTDSFGREHDYLRISLTEKCNLRCTYCMPDEGAPLSPKEQLLSSDEIIRIASLFVKNGVRKIRLTGGEPTIRKDLVEIVERLSALGVDSIGMTSNGIALSRKLPALIAAGLTHLNISLDTLDEHKFELMTRRRGHSTVLKVIEQAAALRSTVEEGTHPSSNRGLRSLKINVVVINRLNDHEVSSFVELTRHLAVSVRFIEYMPFDGNKWSTTKLVPSAKLLADITSKYQHIGVQALTPAVSETTRTYRIQGHAGSFGFISSMTDHFCAGCSRLRLGTDGSLKVCLFGEPTLSLRDMMRSGSSDEAMTRAIGSAVKNKKFAHDGRSEPHPWVEQTALLSTSGRQPERRLAQSAAKLRLNRRQVLLHMLISSMPSDMRMLHSGPARWKQSHSFSSSCGSMMQSEHSSKDKLTHISDKTGKPTMVSVTSKASTTRSATAVGRVIIPRVAYDMLAQPEEHNPAGQVTQSKKGDVLIVAQLAGIMGAKRTSDLIPLCHPLNLANVQVDLALKRSVLQKPEPDSCWIEVSCLAECTGATGVEMEALTGVSIACLTVWDMLKAVAGKEMAIVDVKVTGKSGGKSGDWVRSVDT